MDSGSMEKYSWGARLSCAIGFDFGKNPFVTLDCDSVQNLPNPPKSVETPEETDCVFCKLNGFDGEPRLCYTMQSALLPKQSDLDDGARVPRMVPSATVETSYFRRGKKSRDLWGSE